jgi:hypothetical protein
MAERFGLSRRKVGEELACQVDEFADVLAAQPRPGEGYLEQAAWLFRARAQATEIVLRECVLLPPESFPADGDDPDEDENDAPPGSGERPMVIDCDHPQ